MYILGIETTGPYCSAALLDGQGQLYEKTGTGMMNHLETLMPMIFDLMGERNAAWEDIGHIAVSVGPGSFTGIRIGVSAGKALSQVTRIPLIAVPTLDAFGRQEGGDRGVTVCPVLDARRSQIYGGAYREDAGVISAGPYMLDEFLKMLEGEDHLLFVGDGLKAYGNRIRQWAEEAGKKAEYKDVNQHARGVVLTARHMLREPEHFAGALDLTYDALRPDYMRIPEAERKLREKKAQGEKRG